MTESIIEPDLPILDPHHHLWDLRAMMGLMQPPLHPFSAALVDAAYYTFDALHADTHSGHRVIGTVFLECRAFWDPSRGPELQPVGEVEFVNGVAAQGASGLYGEYRPCAAIVGHADLTLGSGAGMVLDALAAASPRFIGIRHSGSWDADASVLGPIVRAGEGLYHDAKFREGFAELGKRGLTFDAWLLEPQLGDLVDLAGAFPDQPIVLDHCGTPLGIASYKGKLEENFERWRSSIRDLAACENVSIKLGGLAMCFSQLPDKGPAAGFSSEELAAMWKPYIDTCIEAFGAKRAMFESNYPVDRWGATYPVLWNTFKRLVSGASDSEKRDLFAGTAARFYGLEHLMPG